MSCYEGGFQNVGHGNPDGSLPKNLSHEVMSPCRSHFADDHTADISFVYYNASFSDLHLKL